MKLLDIKSCLREFIEGNKKTQTALGETTVDRSMDRGSIPLTSTKNKRQHHLMSSFIFALS